jgi:hypothetical protein
MLDSCKRMKLLKLTLINSFVVEYVGKSTTLTYNFYR